MSRLIANEHLSLEERARQAIDRIKTGHGQMRIPPDATDPDLVISDLLRELQNERARTRDFMARAVNKATGLRHDFRCIESEALIDAVLKGEDIPKLNFKPNEDAPGPTTPPDAKCATCGGAKLVEGKNIPRLDDPQWWPCPDCGGTGRAGALVDLEKLPTVR